MGSRGAKCSRLRDGNEYADIIEIGRFAHAQHSFCSTDHSAEEQYLEQGNIHLVSRNASKTTPAKFVVFFVKEKGAPLPIPGK
jgi:hypothetical protein